MRICYLCADRGIPLDGHKGASAHVRGLVKAFTELGHDVRVIASGSGGEADVGVPVFTIPTPEVSGTVPFNGLGRALRHLWGNVVSEQALGSIISDFDPDLIYERYSPFSIAGVTMAQRNRIPHILEVNAPLAWEGRNYRQQALDCAAESMEKIAFATTSLIVAVSHELRDQLLADGPLETEVRVIPNGVDIDRFSAQGERYLPELEANTVVGFVGSLKAWHGIDVLAEAFRMLAADPRFHLLVVGDGPKAHLLRSLKREFPETVTVVGAVPHEEIPGYIRAMDIAVAPYPQLDRFYFSPLKVLEYMATGRAVVTSRIGQLNSLIKDEDTGVLVPPGDAKALADAIRRLADNEELRRSLGNAAAMKMQCGHSWRSRASEIIELARAVR